MSHTRGFGGFSQGPEPLKELHDGLKRVLAQAAGVNGGVLQARTIVDIMNLIGRCVVAGNVRRTAEIAFGHLASVDPGAERETEDFLCLKDYDRFPERAFVVETSV